MTRRTVYLINLSFGLAGTERRMTNIWHALRARGHVRPILVVPEPLAEVLVTHELASRNDASFWTVPDSMIGRFVRLDSASRLNNLLAHLRSRVVARHYHPVWDRIRRDPDAVIHVGLDTSPLDPPDVPIVYECMDSTLARLGGRHYIKAAARPAVINCQTERIQRALEDRNAHLRPRWSTVPSPNYFGTYPPETIGAGVRDPMSVAFVGRLIAAKNPLTFVDAIAQLRSEGVAARGLILGFGELEDAVRRRIADRGLADVFEISHTPHPVERLQRAAVFVSLQTGDNYGSQALLEAMGAGCAVVASDVGDTHRIITPEVGRRTGFSTQEVAAAIGALLRDPEGTARKGAAASHLVRTRYTADSYAEFLESLYTLAVERHRSPNAAGIVVSRATQAS